MPVVYSAGVKTSAGSTMLPIMSLYGAAGHGAKLLEVGISNTTATAVDVKLVRITTAGTKGAALVRAKHDVDAVVSFCIPVTTHSSTGPTLGDDLGYRASLGAAIGAAVTWKFGDDGIDLPAGATDAIGVIVENGTGQACQVYMKWKE